MKQIYVKLIIAAILVAVIGLIREPSPSPLYAVSSADAVSTFHSIGVAWNPDGASADREATMRFRIEGTEGWRQGHPLWYAGDGEYRGSLVELMADTRYEIELNNGDRTETLVASTWAESFPIGETVYISAFDEPFRVERSGSRDGYTLYMPVPGSEGILDVNGGSNYNIQIDAHHVIIRGFTLRGARINAIELGEAAQDVVIEQNDISGWGRIDERDGWGVNQDSAIFSSHQETERIIIQRNRLHHPRSDSNNWAEESYSTYGGRKHHPEGPQAIYFGNSRGNHVIRYNEIYSDENHKFNDCIGGGANGDRGFPGHNSDIYANIVQDCWDDGLEIEGYNKNVRIWGNYTNRTYMHIATRPTQEGPLYIWRNIADASRKENSPDNWDDDRRGHFLKSGNLNDLGGGRVYVYHNTMLQSADMAGHNLDRSVGSSKGLSGAMRNYVSRNNIFYVLRGGESVHQEKSYDNNDFDYDLYNGDLEKISGHEQNGIRGVPEFVDSTTAATLSELRQATLALRSSSPGYDAGAHIPNFNDQYTDNGPDIGAHESGMPPMRFGISADFVPTDPGTDPRSEPTEPDPLPEPELPVDVDFSEWLYLPLVE